MEYRHGQMDSGAQNAAQPKAASGEVRRAHTRLAFGLFAVGLVAVVLLWAADSAVRGMYLRSIDHHAVLDRRVAAIGELYTQIELASHSDNNTKHAAALRRSLAELAVSSDVPQSLALPQAFVRSVERVVAATETRAADAQWFSDQADKLLPELVAMRVRHARHRQEVLAHSRRQIERVSRISAAALFGAAATLLWAATLALSELRRRRRSERVIRESAASLQRLLEAMPIAVHVRDADGRLIVWNKSAEETFGWLRHEILGTAQQLVSDVAGSQARAMRAAALAGHMGEAQVLQAVRRDGTLLDARTATAPYRNAEGQIVGTVAVSQDVSDELMREAQRHAQNDKQREAVVREVHHRIKNHLQGLAALVHQRLSPAGEPHADADAIVAQLLSLATVHGIKAGGRNGALGLLESVDAIAAHVSGLTGVACELREHTQHVSNVEPRIVDAHSVAVALAVNELLTNAVKHRPRGSQSRVAIDVVEREAAVEIRIRNRGVLPERFDLEALRHAGSGMSLITALLPRRGAMLDYVQRDGWVIATLTLAAPVIECGPAAQTLADTGTVQEAA
jgi:PAS domain S-box-containing protein